jgi:hypothetical protein
MLLPNAYEFEGLAPWGYIYEPLRAKQYQPLRVYIQPNDRMRQLKMSRDLTLATVIAGLCMMLVDTRSIGSDNHGAGKYKFTNKLRIICQLKVTVGS